MVMQPHISSRRRLAAESLNHCLWECSHESCTRSLVKHDEHTNEEHLEGHILGFALWWILLKKAWILGDRGRLIVFCVQRNEYIVQPIWELQVWCSNRPSDIWHTITSITLWNIWKSRCKVGLTGQESRPKETIIVVWYDLVMNIRAQYEELE